MSIECPAPACSRLPSIESRIAPSVSRRAPTGPPSGAASTARGMTSGGGCAGHGHHRGLRLPDLLGEGSGRDLEGEIRVARRAVVRIERTDDDAPPAGAVVGEHDLAVVGLEVEQPEPRAQGSAGLVGLNGLGSRPLLPLLPSQRGPRRHQTE